MSLLWQSNRIMPLKMFSAEPMIHSTQKMVPVNTTDDFIYQWQLLIPLSLPCLLFIALCFAEAYFGFETISLVTNQPYLSFLSAFAVMMSLEPQYAWHPGPTWTIWAIKGSFLLVIPISSLQTLGPSTGLVSWLPCSTSKSRNSIHKGYWQWVSSWGSRPIAPVPDVPTVAALPLYICSTPSLQPLPAFLCPLFLHLFLGSSNGLLSVEGSQDTKG